MTHDERTQPRRSAWGQIVFWLVLALAVVAVIWVRQGASRGNQGRVHAAVGRPLPDLSLKGLTGGATDVDLQDTKGQAALINFWGVWCGPCRYELPHIAQLRRDFAARQDFRLLAVSCPQGDESLAVLKDQTRQFLAEKKIELPTYADPDGATRRAVGMALGDVDLRSLPTTILLDRDGIIRAVWVGYESGVEDDMHAAIEQVLAKK